MIEKRIGEWITSDGTGISSCAIVAIMMGADPAKMGRKDAPRDPADLGRCLRLLELIPEWKPRMHEMAKLGGRWPAAVKCWEEISACMDAEVGIDWSKGLSAPKTCDMMRRCGL
jgi:hypothetical protein